MTLATDAVTDTMPLEPLKCDTMLMLMLRALTRHEENVPCAAMVCFVSQAEQAVGDFTSSEAAARSPTPVGQMRCRHLITSC